MARAMKMEAVAASFQTIKETVASTMENVGYEELVPTQRIDLAHKNTYGGNDTPDDYMELANQIEAVGLLNPLGVIKENGRYRLFSGERRYKAIIQHLHWDKIPCRVFEGVSINKAQLMLHMANGSRDYSPGHRLELYEEYLQLLTDMKSSGELTGGLQAKLAEMLHVTQRQVRSYKQLSENLTEAEKKAVITGACSITDAKDTAKHRAEQEAVNTMELTIDNTDWDTCLKEVILNRYDCPALYRAYVLEAATPKEATKQVLKPQYGHSGGTHYFSDGTTGFCTYTSTSMELEYQNRRKVYTYAEIDTAVRQLIRSDTLVSLAQASKIFHSYWRNSN